MITFKAQYIKSAEILAQNYNRDYTPYRASIVELNPKSKNDLISLNRTNMEWDNCETMADFITATFNTIHEYESNPNDERFFALTRQKDNYNQLDECHILGLVHTKRNPNNKLKIEYLQTNPDTSYTSFIRSFKHVGEALVKFVIEFFPDKEIFLNAERSAIPFYEKIGWKKTGDLTKMIFKK